MSIAQYANKIAMQLLNIFSLFLMNTCRIAPETVHSNSADRTITARNRARPYNCRGEVKYGITYTENILKPKSTDFGFINCKKIAVTNNLSSGIGDTNLESLELKNVLYRIEPAI